MLRCSTSGLAHGRLDGAIMSSHWRPMNDTTASWCGSVPGTPLVAWRHQSSAITKACAHWLNGHWRHAGAAKRGSTTRVRARPVGSAACVVALVSGPATADCIASLKASVIERDSRIASSICLPGAVARCIAQSLQASHSDCGDRPKLMRARLAVRRRSRSRSGA